MRNLPVPFVPDKSFILEMSSESPIMILRINNDLKPELQKYTDLSIQEVQTQSVYEGSVEIIFTVILSFLELVGGMKDLYDAVHLIKEIAERHINRKLSDKFGNHFRVDTYAIAPREEDYWRFEEGCMVKQGNNEECVF